MHGDTTREGVVDGHIFHISRWLVASLLIHVLSHVEVNWVVSQQLLAHMLQLHAFHVDRFESKSKLESRDSLVKIWNESFRTCIFRQVKKYTATAHDPGHPAQMKSFKILDFLFKGEK